MSIGKFNKHTMLYKVDVVQQAVIVSCLLTGITESTTCSCHKRKRKWQWCLSVHLFKWKLPLRIPCILTNLEPQSATSWVKLLLLCRKERIVMTTLKTIKAEIIEPHQWSNLPQGGLEVPCVLIIMSTTTNSHWYSMFTVQFSQSNGCVTF